MSEKTGLPARDAARIPDNGELVKVLSKVLELERERVAVSTRQAENSAAAIRGVDADNERQYQFHRNRFERQQDHREERWRSSNKKQWVLLGTAIVLSGVVLAFLFFGSPSQQQQALWVTSHVVSLGAGLGFGHFLAVRGKRVAP